MHAYSKGLLQVNMHAESEPVRLAAGSKRAVPVACVHTCKHPNTGKAHKHKHRLASGRWHSRVHSQRCPLSCITERMPTVLHYRAFVGQAPDNAINGEDMVPHPHPHRCPYQP